MLVRGYQQLFRIPLLINHLVLPYGAAGALTAIEDAEALYVTLRDATRATVHDCLQRAFRIRYKRASACQADSRSQGLQSPPFPHAMKNLYSLWDYPRAERWEVERPDMVLPA
jgi:2-polyprenyl-6-methoxyphenol hydroxylase-like FAD-dependent oxidoreductase